MPGINVVPPGFKLWPRQDADLEPDEVQRMYESGFAGCILNDEAKEEFDELCATLNSGMKNGAEIAHAMGWAGSGAGKVILPFTHALKVFPNCLPGPAQQRGDCVSHGTKNAILITLACEIVAGRPDEVTGKIEGPPDLPAEGVTQGVLSSEYIYWWRGYNGDGWHCPTAASVVLRRGVLLKKPYSELGIDLTRYSGSLAGKYGSRQPPEEIASEGAKHLVRTATKCNSFEEIRDFLANGYGISTCGGQGWSSDRDENGFSRQRGSWAHAMAITGADDRDEIKQKYGEPLVLITNSWGRWNNGGKRVLGTQIDIPDGSFWAKWSDAKRRDFTAFSSLNGWPAQNIPDYVVV